MPIGQLHVIYTTLMRGPRPLHCIKCGKQYHFSLLCAYFLFIISLQQVLWKSNVSSKIFCVQNSWQCIEWTRGPNSIKQLAVNVLYCMLGHFAIIYIVQKTNQNFSFCIFCVCTNSFFCYLAVQIQMSTYVNT